MVPTLGEPTSQGLFLVDWKTAGRDGPYPRSAEPVGGVRETPQRGEHVADRHLRMWFIATSQARSARKQVVGQLQLQTEISRGT
jgi:hypothetical protein